MLISWRLMTTPLTSRATVATRPPCRVTSSSVRSPRRMRIDVAASFPACHPVLHRPFTVDLDHSYRQEIGDRRRQDAVVRVQVGGVGADRRGHEVDDSGVTATLGRKLAGTLPASGIGASGARDDLGAHRSVSGRTISGLAMM